MLKQPPPVISQDRVSGDDNGNGGGAVAADSELLIIIMPVHYSERVISFTHIFRECVAHAGQLVSGRPLPSRDCNYH